MNLSQVTVLLARSPKTNLPTGLLLYTLKMPILVNSRLLNKRVACLRKFVDFPCLFASRALACCIVPLSALMTEPRIVIRYSLIYNDDANANHISLSQRSPGQNLTCTRYYLIQTDPNNLTEKIWGFPQGFEMIAGDTNQRNFTYPIPDIEKSLWTGEYADQKFLRQAALGFNCLNYGAPAEPSLFRHFMPDKEYIDANCKNGVRLELMFPSCWNGAATPDDKKSHVAYPSQVMTGTCPPGFPKRLLSLFYETIVRPDAFPGRNGRFVFANGDVSGMFLSQSLI